MNNQRKDRVDIADRKENNVAVEVLAKHIVGVNGIGYTLGEDGLYYPNLCLPEHTDYEIGRYGRMREKFLKGHRKSLYRELLLNGVLNEHPHETEGKCYRMINLLVGQMKKRQGMTAQLKSEEQIRWGKR